MEKTVLPIMIFPYDDELLESWIKRLTDANGLTINLMRAELFNEHIDKSVRSGRYDVYYLEGLYWKEKTVDDFPAADKLLLQHTTIPFMVGTSINVMETAAAVQSVLYNCGDGLYDLCWPHKILPRRFCPECVKEDEALGKAFYLKTWHQIPGIRVCAKHGTPLAVMDKWGKDIKGKIYADTSEKDIAAAKNSYRKYSGILDFKPAKPSGPLNGVTPESRKGIFMYAVCGTCGIRFLTTFYALAKGRGCPECERGTDVIGRQIKMLPAYQAVGQIKSVSQKDCLKHECGKIYKGKVSDVIWNGISCSCRKSFLQQRRH